MWFQSSGDTDAWDFTIFRHTSPIFNSVLVEQLLHPGHVRKNSGCALFLAATHEKPSDIQWRTCRFEIPYLVLLYETLIVSSVGQMLALCSQRSRAYTVFPEILITQLSHSPLLNKWPSSHIKAGGERMQTTDLVTFSPPLTPPSFKLLYLLFLSCSHPALMSFICIALLPLFLFSYNVA